MISDVVNLIEELLNEKYLLEILKENNILPFSLEDTKSSENFFEKIKKDLKTNEWIIAVFGIQGCGKSSFLNALILKDNLLPTNVNETTCVPTLIRLSKDNKDKIIVHFNDGRVEEIEFSREELKEYVDNNFNPKNKKQVEFVEIDIKSPLLKEDVVFVDLPGFGSLTSENAKVVMDFMEKAHAGIFILRTIPPITKQESFFIKYALPRLRKVWFIQNRWNNERDEEVEDAKVYNINMLNKIINEMGFKNHLKLENNFFVIDISKAFEGVVKSDEIIIQDSGLKAFKDNFEQSLYILREELIKDLIHLFFKLMLEALEKIRIRKMDIFKDIKNLEIEIANEKEKLQNYMNELLEKIKNLENESQKKLYYLISKVDEECKKAKKSLLSDMYERIEGGIVDGEGLTKAYNDLVKIKIDELYQTFFDLVKEYYDFISEKISEINIDKYEPQKKFVDIATMNIPGSLKFEKIIPQISSMIVGGIGTWAGAKIGAKVGSIFGPIGAVIGGFLGGLLGLVIGDEIKSEVELERKKSAKSAVNSAIEMFYEESKKYFIDLLNKIDQMIFENLEKWLKFQETKVLNEIDLKTELLKKREEELVMNKLIQQEEFLVNKIKLLKGVILDEYH